MLPTFIIAGAAKSGTTSLWQYLRAHPEVCMARIKETNFFTREIPSARYDKGLVWYESLFQTCVAATAIGEASPAYMSRQDTPGLIYKTIPNVQLLFLLRDPVNRLYSQYWYQRQEGLKLPDFDVMVKERHPQLQRLIRNSSYHLHLKRYQEFFSKEQIAVLLSEDMLKDPVGFMQKVYRMLGVDPTFVPSNLGKQYNQARQVRVSWFQRLLKALGPKIMYLDLPDWLFRILQRGRNLFWFGNTTKSEYLPLPDALRQALLPEFAETTAYIEKYLGRSLSLWREV